MNTGDGHRPDDAHDHDHSTGLKGAVASIFQPHSHDAADSLDSVLEASDRGIRARCRSPSSPC